MTANRKSTGRTSIDARVKSDMARVDAHVIQDHEYDELPDLADRDIAEAICEVNGIPVQRGRPRKPDRKLSTNLRLDPDVLDHFKAGGPGWQGRINAALRTFARLPAAKA